jgi:hypothetical protein
MEGFTETETRADNGQQIKDVKHLRVTMPNGKPYSMPADVATYILERFARTKRKDFIQAHADAVMGEEQ